jgi:HlyD family secretion protein
MRKKLTWIIIILVVLVLILVGLKKAGVLGKEEGTKVSSEKVIKRDITEIVTASGKIYPEIEVKISPDISGEIVDLKVMEGDSVRKGQELARIYADIYTTQRDQAEAQLNQQEAIASNSSAQLPGLKATLDQAKRTYDRQKQLLDQKVISRAEFETAESAMMTAQANYTAAQQSIKGNLAGAASAQANLNIAAKNLGRTTVTAPINGVVSLLSVKKGERVVGNSMMAGTEMMRVADMSKIEAIVDVGENDIPKVHLGDSANIEVDAYNSRKFRGVVTQIASSITTAAGTQTTTVSTNDVTNYKVHIRLDPESYKDLYDSKRPKSFPFRPGMSASADIQTKTHKQVLSVPINSVTTRDKNNQSVAGGKVDLNKPEETNDQATVKTPQAGDYDIVVFLLGANNLAKKVKVKTSIQDINNIEITDGLKEGDEIISGPYSIVSKTLKDSMKVQVVPKEKLFEIKK